MTNILKNLLKFLKKDIYKKEIKFEEIPPKFENKIQIRSVKVKKIKIKN